MSENNTINTTTTDTPVSDFKSFGLPESIVDSLDRLGITAPTPIQAEAIPLALAGHDILGSAQTGTGKTLAYITPLCVRLLSDPKQAALVMTPTRELAIQVRDMISKILAKKPQFDMALLIGGDPMIKQLGQLRRRPQLIIGTPGRINDHLNRGSLNIRNTQFLVLDETDRMLDMGFSEQLETIIEVMHEDRQTLMFSATMPANIVRISKQYLKNPKRITIGSTTTPVAHIKQDVIHTTHADKFNHLLRELNERTGSVIVFVKTKLDCETIKDRLCDENHEADAIHGDLHQRKRERVVASFRASKSRILVATDIAARGLDVPHIRHVVNYDLPQCPEDYIHRIGRTGRAGADGSALCLLSAGDRNKWRAISQLMNPGAPIDFPKGAKSEGGSSDRRRPGGGGFGGGYGRDRDSAPSSGGGFGRGRSNASSGGGGRGSSGGFGRSAEGGYAGKSERSGGGFSERGSFKRDDRRTSFDDKAPRSRDFGDDSSGGSNWSDTKPANKSSSGKGDFAKSDFKPASKREFPKRDFKSGPKGDFKSAPKGDFKSPRGEFKGEPRGEFKSAPRGDFKGEPRGEPRGEFRGDRKPEARGDRPNTSRFGSEKPEGAFERKKSPSFGEKRDHKGFAGPKKAFKPKDAPRGAAPKKAFNKA